LRPWSSLLYVVLTWWSMPRHFNISVIQLNVTRGFVLFCFWFLVLVGWMTFSCYRWGTWDTPDLRCSFYTSSPKMQSVPGALLIFNSYAIIDQRCLMSNSQNIVETVYRWKDCYKDCLCETDSASQALHFAARRGPGPCVFYIGLL
jgi:hypothetical protein